MNVTNAEAPEIASDLADLNLTPLSEIAESDAGAGVLARILAEQSSRHVPVAAFQSSL